MSVMHSFISGMFGRESNKPFRRLHTRLLRLDFHSDRLEAKLPNTPRLWGATAFTFQRNSGSLFHVILVNHKPERKKKSLK